MIGYGEQPNPDFCGVCSMADTLLIVLVNADVDRPETLIDPLFQAIVAAAMEYDVEVILGGAAKRLARPGVAVGLAIPGSEKTVHDLLREAHGAGVLLKLIADTRDRDLIPEIDECVSNAYLIGRVMARNTVTLSY